MRLVWAVVIAAFLVAGDIGSSRLFDGRSLAGWTQIGGQPGNWAVVEGGLELRGRGKDWLSTNRAFANFELRLEYKLAPGGNSGVLIRAPHEGDPSFDGLEIQLLDDDAPAYRSLQPWQYCGSIYGLVAAKRGHSRKAGEWNELRIEARGSKVRVTLNQAVVVETDLATLSPVPAKHRGPARTSGFLGLQSHESPASFREIEIRELP
jgi:hypothetical protein